MKMKNVLFARFEVNPKILTQNKFSAIQQYHVKGKMKK